jgi:chemotaxis protein CheY-P-specific phosphatase CheC
LLSDLGFTVQHKSAKALAQLLIKPESETKEAAIDPMDPDPLHIIINNMLSAEGEYKALLDIKNTVS